MTKPILSQDRKTPRTCNPRHYETRNCKNCNKPRFVSTYDINRGRGNYCSIKCRCAHKRRPIADRFWEKIQKGSQPNSCWVWTGHRINKGYGQIHYSEKSQTMLAHRLSWNLHFGKIPKGLEVLHRCDNPPCCRPDHLFLGTQKQNMQDALKKGRTRNGALTMPDAFRKGEKHGQAKLSDQIVIEMRRRRKTEGISYTKLGKEYGVAHTVAREAVLGITWGHVKS